MSLSLSCNGFPLSVSEQTFGGLRRTSPGTDADSLRARMEEDGYLFLPALLDRENVGRARLSVLERLSREENLLDPGRPLEEGALLPGAKIKVNTDFTAGDPHVEAVLYQGEMMAFFRRFLGGEILHFDYTWFRAKDRGNGTRPHCDIVYMGRGTRRLFTAWAPFGDIPVEQGGLILLEKSHLKGEQLRAYLESDVDTYCENGEDGKPAKPFDGALGDDAERVRSSLGGRWLTEDFHMGDVLIFGMGTVHAGLDNRVDRLRLSSDSRYQLASEPADERWIGENPPAHGPLAKKGVIC